MGGSEAPVSLLGSEVRDARAAAPNTKAKLRGSQPGNLTGRSAARDTSKAFARKCYELLRFYHDFTAILLDFETSRGLLGGPGRSWEVLGGPRSFGGGPRICYELP